METKICIKCNRELPLEKFNIKTGQMKKRYYSGVCKECEYKRQRAYLEEKRKIKFSDDLEILIQRKYKEINPKTILDISATGIDLIEDDEVFVRVQDCVNIWISNYGRLVKLGTDGYVLQKGSYDYYGNLRYTVNRDVIENGACVLKRCALYAAKAVVQAFIVNYDYQNNVFIWHKNGDRKDNYFKHLFPLNQKQYQVIKNHFEKTGDDSEDFILKVMNDIRFKPDDWSKKATTPTVCGVGYHGSSEVDTTEKSFIKWHDMMNRCYNVKTQMRHKQYEGCTVCEEWHNYTNFKKWYEEHCYQVDDERMDLDKDILCKGNKVYSPDTCIIVPHNINTLFLFGQAKRGKYPVGVHFDSERGKYRTSLNIDGEKKKSGRWDTPEEAFAEYKNLKEAEILKMANKYKGKIPNRVYNAMRNWKIEITD